MFYIRNLLGNDYFQWFIIFLVSTVILLLTKTVLVTRLGKIFKNTKTSIDDLFYAGVKSIHPIYLVILSLEIASSIISFENRYSDWLIKLFAIATIIQLGITGAKLINCWMDCFFKSDDKSAIFSSTSMGLFKVLVKTGFFIFVFIIFLHFLGVNITTLIAGLGVGGVAVALALQNILGDLFASLTIIMDKPFSVGDYIVTGNISGTIEYVGIKNTRIRSLSGEQIVVSNSVLLKDQIKNYQVMTERRVLFNLGVIYQTETEKLKKIPEIIKSIIDATTLGRFDRCHFLKFGPSSLDFEVVFWVKDPSYRAYADLAQEINLEIIKRFSEEKIDFAYPTSTVYVNNGLL